MPTEKGDKSYFTEGNDVMFSRLEEGQTIFDDRLRQFQDCLLHALDELSERQDAWNQKFISTYLNQSSDFGRKRPESQYSLSTTRPSVVIAESASDEFNSPTFLSGDFNPRPSTPTFKHRFDPLSESRREQNFHKMIFNKVEAKRVDRQAKGCAKSVSHMFPRIKPPKCLKAIVDSNAFAWACALLTLLFAIIVGLEADQEMRAAWSNEEIPKWVHTAAFVCNAFYALEVFLRILAGGLFFFLGRDWCWNCFDFLLVTFSILDMLGLGNALSVLRVARISKVIKAFRVIRVLKMVGELRLLLVSLIKSMAALFWCLVFLLLTTYLVSVCLSHGAAQYVRDHASASSDSYHAGVLGEVRIYYQNVPTAMYTLVSCATGGGDWRPPADAIWEVGWIYGCAFFLFVLVTVVGLMNVITGIFVEHASNIVDIDREVAIMQHLKQVEKDVEEAVALFAEVDTEREGTVSIAALKEFCAQPRVIAYFSTFDIDMTEPKDVVTLFDANGSGTISEEEFVIGCMSCRGATKKTELTLASQEESKHLSHLEDRMRKIQASIRRLNASDGTDGTQSLPAFKQVSVTVDSMNVHDVGFDRSVRADTNAMLAKVSPLQPKDISPRFPDTELRICNAIDEMLREAGVRHLGDEEARHISPILFPHGVVGLNHSARKIVVEGLGKDGLISWIDVIIATDANFSKQESKLQWEALDSTLQSECLTRHCDGRDFRYLKFVLATSAKLNSGATQIVNECAQKYSSTHGDLYAEYFAHKHMMRIETALP